MSSLHSPSPGVVEDEKSTGELYTGLLSERHSTDNGTLESAILHNHDQEIDIEVDNDYDGVDEEENDTIGSGEANIFILSGGYCKGCGKDGRRLEACEKCKEMLCLDCIVKYRKGGRVLYLCSECADEYKKWHRRKIIAVVAIVVIAVIVGMVAYIWSFNTKRHSE